MAVSVICCGIFLLIMDPQTGLAGASEGLELCIRTVIPSLLPFFFLSVLLTSHLAGKETPWLRPVGKLLRLPTGGEAIFLIGILGGYPVGAQAVAQAWSAGRLDQQNARRMLGFCSNAGPSFLFGILGAVFSSPAAPWALWFIHILSAMLVGILLPGCKQAAMAAPERGSMAPSQALERALRIMANVCGWVILFRVVICFLDRWVLWLFPAVVKNILLGTLELTNGCCMLGSIKSEGLRFILASCFLAFGGLCVSMQTVSVTGKLGTGWYFPGKVLQTMFSFLMAWGYQAIFYPASSRAAMRPVVVGPALAVVILLILYLKKYKNNSSIPALSGV